MTDIDSAQLADNWIQFCEKLRTAGSALQRPGAPRSTFDRAEGYRYLTRLLRAGLDSQIESSNASYPRFFQLANETIKIGNDNPDNIYHNANLDGRLDYRLCGNRGSVNYLSFGTKAGSYETTGTMEPSGHLDISDVELDSNGDFEIILSTTPQQRNWLPMREDSRSVIVRQTFDDRSKEIPAYYDIECLNPRQSAGLLPASFAQQLLASAQFVDSTANLFADWMDSYSSHVNQLPYDDQEKCQRAGGDSSIQYLQSYWHLQADEALLIHARHIPECTTWNFQLSNYWMESLDYRYHRVSYNQRSAQPEADGSVKLLVAHQRPGEQYPNWVETCGHERGGMLWRWIGVEDSREYPVDCTVVPYSNLK